MQRPQAEAESLVVATAAGPLGYAQGELRGQLVGRQVGGVGVAQQGSMCLAQEVGGGAGIGRPPSARWAVTATLASASGSLRSRA
ncbi:hypothetical protein ACFSVJ_00310 [Prauserella oleivorans]